MGALRAFRAGNDWSWNAEPETAGRPRRIVWDTLLTLGNQAIGAAPDAIKMQRVVNFYEKLPRGPAPEVKATGLLGRYQAKHFGKNPTVKRMSQNTLQGCCLLVCCRFLN